MSARLLRLLDALIRLAGGDPAVVRPLADALRRAADGRAELLKQRTNPKASLSADGVRILVLVVTGLGSCFLAIAMKPAEHPLPLGPLLLGALHALLGFGWLLGRVGPALLADDDRAVLGWWPLASRDLLLARVIVLGRELLQFSAALCVLPLVVLAALGRPPLLSALLLLAALLVQTVSLVFGVLLLANELIRRQGRDRAERFIAPLADGNGFALVWILMLVAPKLTPHLVERAAWTPALPFFWAGLCADPAHPARFLPAALLLTGTAALIFARARRTDRLTESPAAPRQARPAPGGRHWTDVVARVLAPVGDHPEGWLTRTLFVAHLRNDWRFFGAALSLPLMFGGMLLVSKVNGDTGGPDLDVTASALMDVRYSFWIPMFAPMAFMSLLSSSRPDALWPVALADLDNRRLLSAQRRIGRVLLLTPLLALYSAQALALGAAWTVVLTDALLLAVLWDLSILFQQGRMRPMTFGTAFTQNQDWKRLGVMLASLLVSIGFAAMLAFYDQFAPARIPLWILVAALQVLMRTWVRRRAAAGRLKMDVVWQD